MAIGAIAVIAISGAKPTRSLSRCGRVLASFVTGHQALTKADSLHKDARLVALNSSLDINCALLIDRLAGLRNQDAFNDFSERPADSPEFFGNRYTDESGASWQEINLQTLAQQAHFLTIAA